MEVEWLAMRMVGQRPSSWQKRFRLAAKRLADPVAEEKAVGVVAEVMVVVVLSCGRSIQHSRQVVVGRPPHRIPNREQRDTTVLCCTSRPGNREMHSPTQP